MKVPQSLDIDNLLSQQNSLGCSEKAISSVSSEHCLILSESLMSQQETGATAVSLNPVIPGTLPPGKNLAEKSDKRVT